MLLLNEVFNIVHNNYFAHGSGGKVLWWARLSVCLSVHKDISGITRTIFTNFLCMLPMAVARSFSCRVTKSQCRN